MNRPRNPSRFLSCPEGTFAHGSDPGPSATSLVEIGVALSILSLLIALLYGAWSSQRRQASQLERGSYLVTAACLLQEALTWDLLRSLPITVLPGDLVSRGHARASVTLPVWTGYRSDQTPSPEYRSIAYEFDPHRGAVLRAGHALVPGGITRAEFLWSAQTPTTLVVTLVGEAPLAGRPPEAVLRLPAPDRTDPEAHWRFAAHHQGARRVD